MILEKLNIEKLSQDVIVGINDTNIEDSTYNLPTCMFPLHSSSIADYELEYGEEYINGSTEFYLQRIKTYLDMNFNL